MPVLGPVVQHIGQHVVFAGLDRQLTQSLLLAVLRDPQMSVSQGEATRERRGSPVRASRETCMYSFGLEHMDRP